MKTKTNTLVCHSERSEESTRRKQIHPWILRFAQNDRKASSSGPKRRGAFTLLEVLVAIAIFAFMATVLAMSYLNVLQGYEVAARMNENDEDVAFARAQMLAEPDRKVIEDGGEFDSATGRHVKWSATLTSTEINDLFTVTFEVEITDPAKSDPRKVTETFTVLRPTWSDPAERSKLLQTAKDKIAQLKEPK